MLRSRQKSINWIWILILIIIGFSILVLINYLLVTYLGAGNDFLFYLEKYRALFKSGISPYDLNQNSMFTQALFGFILYLPFILFSNDAIASSIWLSLNQIIYILAIILLINLLEWKAKSTKLIASVIFTLSIFFTVINLFQGQSTTLRLAIIIGVCWSVFRKHEELTGILIALFVIFPLSNLHIIIFFLFWSVFNRRGKTFLWFFISLFILSALAALITPDWILQWLRHLFVITPQAFGFTLSRVLFAYWGEVGTRISTAISILSVALILIEWWINRHSTGRAFIWVLCLSLLLGFWIGVPVVQDSILYIVVMLILTFIILDERWKKVGNALSSIIGLIVLLIPWTVFFSDRVSTLLTPLNNPVHMIIVPVIFIPILYWIRWWCIHPPEMWFDFVRRSFRS